jgi:hypothetical protein
MIFTPAFSGDAAACPFCVAVSNTLTDGLREASAAALAECIVPAAERRSQADHQPIHQFRIVEWIKGSTSEFPGSLSGGRIEAFSHIPFSPGQLCLLLADTESPQPWNTPLAITPESAEYLRGLANLPPDSTRRLLYFLPYLDHPDPLIADDAYNEFARATLSDVAALRGRLDRHWIMEQLRSNHLPVHRRRLCWTLLGVCGNEADLELIDELIARSRLDPDFDLGLDAALGCYLTLGGERALGRVEREYLGNPHADYGEVFSAVMAVRVHGTELDRFSQARLAASLRLVLDQPPLADLVIPELARWEDWSVIQRLEGLFIEANPDIEFIRVPIVRYLRACPLPEASEAVERLKRVDPQAVQRADTFFFGSFSDAPFADKSVEHEPPLVAPVGKPQPPSEPPRTITADDAASSPAGNATTKFWRRWIFLMGSLVIVAFVLRRRILLTSAGPH